MFSVFLIALAGILFFITLMAVGVLAGREPLKGTCGGLNRFRTEEECPICGGNPSMCDNKVDGGGALLARDAMEKK